MTPARLPLKTACRHGHPVSQENTYLAPNGSWMCRICRRIAKQQYTDRQRAKKGAAA